VTHLPYIAACILVIAAWCIICGQAVLALKRGRWLWPGPEKPDSRLNLSVIIPARNEERDIAESLRSVLQQSGDDFEVIVVNDHSTDTTAEIIADVEQSDPRIKPIHNPDLPEGWLGKCNAMQRGAKMAVGDYFLFSDADIIHARGSFATALSVMEKEGYDFISLFPRFVVQPFWEHVMLPMYMVGLGKLLAVKDPELPTAEDARAAGAFMLIKSQVFRELGGFQQIKTEMADDIALARLVARRGYSAGFRLAPDCLRVSMFKNNRDAFWSTTKNVLLAVEGRTWLAVPQIFLAAFLFMTPLVAFAAGILQNDLILSIIGGAVYVLQYASLFLMRRLVDFQPLKAIFFPLVVIVATCTISRALFYYYVKGAILWRGRTIKMKQHFPEGSKNDR